MASDDDVSSDEQLTIDLVKDLQESGNLHPLIARLRDGEVGPEHARDALRVLFELDPDLLVQVTLDGLIEQYLVDPGLAHQPRRVVRFGQEVADAE